MTLPTATQRFEEYLDEVIEVTYDGFQITRRQILIGYEFTLVRDAFYSGLEMAARGF